MKTNFVITLHSPAELTEDQLFEVQKSIQISVSKSRVLTDLWITVKGVEDLDRMNN